MVEIKIDASKIKGEGDALQKLTAFLKEKASGEVTNDGGKLTLKTDAKGVNKKYAKVLLKKFLHQQELKENYRVIGGEEDTLTISERKVYEKE
ncbi:MAG: 60S ribosomal protein L22 [Candidatus Bathyarchaeia archaeon]